MPDAPAWLINAIGVIAGLCSMASFVPQIVKIVRERRATGVALRMYAITIVGFICWTAFGILSGSWPVAVANAVCLILVTTILVLRLRFGDGAA
jgi:MtN3 and saliva related transmembrane protein